jgi:hypothetical protein
MAETIQYFDTDHVEHEYSDRDYEAELAELYAAEALAQQMAKSSENTDPSETQTTE